ncbi:NAD(P)/FAD-dependent oxidoreductase [Nocardia cyriacigeorgica]|uniref:NAD(P)/FAD-dependent oxidoreductase n=1 Tax=Nocardia cyriacigeorgica TaxID=135487 RepID=UPI00189343EC|nr:FAD-dependent oxidoreductase [Nocardia cyriacigeorgica]MBF6088626.1 FAD-dependent oxidoreductase [Nocardia cyriacigeorgica]MBF6093219.1 FAD-dependent oxidoreductase [Nocardia cyriacigeorgica]MBF6346150.1 FAD-dependent oxidoreductase [Nocardia cyriacigeorgica]
MSNTIDVVVIGGGYAGVMAANRLTQRDDLRVTVINPRPVFVPRLRLHQLVGGTHDAVVDYTEILAGSVRLVTDSATRIDATARSVSLAEGAPIGYDYLIYAVGSGDATPRVPGAAEFAYPIATLEAAQRLRSTLFDTPMTAPVTVIGGGPTGIETAAELAEQGRDVTLVCGKVLGPYLHPKARRTARKYFTKLGVNVIEGSEAMVTAVTRQTVELADGQTMPSAVTIWTAGFDVPDLAARSGLSTDITGRLLTDETLTSVDDERIVAAGDCSAPSDLPFRMAAYTAYCLGAHAADTLLHRIAGEQPTPIDLSFPAMCLSFGRDAGIYQLGHKNDTPMRLYFSGFAGKKLKEFACTAGIKHLATEAHKPGSHHWFTDGKHRPMLLETKRDSASAPVA